MHYFVPRRSGVMPVCNQHDRVFRGRPLLRTRPRTVAAAQFRSKLNESDSEQTKQEEKRRRFHLAHKKQRIRDDARRIKLKQILLKAEGSENKPQSRGPSSTEVPILENESSKNVFEPNVVAKQTANISKDAEQAPAKKEVMSTSPSSTGGPPKRGNTSEDMAHILSMTGAEVYLPCILGPPRVKVFEPIEYSAGVSSVERKEAMDRRKASMQAEIDDSKSLALKLIQKTMAADAEKKKADYQAKKAREAKVMRDCLANMQDNKDDQDRLLELKRIEGLVGMAKKSELDDDAAFEALAKMDAATDAFISEPRFNKAFPHELKRIHESLRRECAAAQKVVEERIRNRDANALKEQAMKIKLIEYANSNLKIAEQKAHEEKQAADELKAYGKSIIERGQRKQKALEDKMARKKKEKLAFGEKIKEQARELQQKRAKERKKKFGGDIVNLDEYVDTVGGSRFFVHAKVPPSYYKTQGGLKQFPGDPPGFMYKIPWPPIVVGLIFSSLFNAQYCKCQ